MTNTIDADRPLVQGYGQFPKTLDRSAPESSEGTEVLTHRTVQAATQVLKTAPGAERVEPKIRESSDEGIQRLEWLTIGQGESTLVRIISDQGARQLYSQVFGTDLHSLEIIQKKCKEKRNRGESADQIDAEIREKMNLNALMSGWEALPKPVKELFGNISSFSILDNLETFLFVLKVIHAYNLVRVGKKAFRDFNPHLSTREGFLKAGESVVGRLARDGENITTLDLSAAGMTVLPIEVTQLNNLRHLSLDTNALSTLPPQIKNLTSLTSLDVSRNQLTALPSEIRNLTFLNSLTVLDNHLTELPAEIRDLKFLASLNVSYNQLGALPSEITNLKFLTSLNASHNQLTSLPPGVEKLPFLTSLDVSFNQVETLPLEVWAISKRAKLSIRGNKITSVPHEIIAETNIVL